MINYAQTKQLLSDQLAAMLHMCDMLEERDPQHNDDYLWHVTSLRRKQVEDVRSLLNEKRTLIDD